MTKPVVKDRCTCDEERIVPMTTCEFRAECEKVFGECVWKNQPHIRCATNRKFAIIVVNRWVKKAHAMESAHLGELYHPRLDRILALKMEED